MRRMLFWLRWSARDLRRRWLVVCALALVIAIGTGVAAAFGSLSEWRRLSNDASYTMLGMHDIAVSFDDTRVDRQRALAAVRQIPQVAALRSVEGRLTMPTQVDVSDRDGTRTVLPGRIVGVELTTPDGPSVDRVVVTRGSPLGSSDAKAPVAWLEQAFAQQFDLAERGTVRIAGGVRVSYAGWAQSPAYLLNGQGAWLGEPVQAALFVPLGVAQRLTGETDQINQVLVTLAEGTDVAAVQQAIDQALRAVVPEAPATVNVRSDNETYRILYEDIDNDQKFWDFVSILVLGGAALATFNLSSRVVAAQRREIGVGAALGLRGPALAIRPALFGIQVALLGVLAGIGVGLLLGWAITGILDNILPLPQWRTPMQVGVLAKASALGMAIPLLGIGYPIVRAVRVQPADAIRTAHIVTGGGRLGRRPGRLRLPGSSIGHLPVRQVLRAPGRATLTAAGVGASIAVLVALLGMLDSMDGALGVGEREQTRGGSDRTLVGLDTFHPVADPTVAAIRTLPQVAEAQPTLRVPARAVGPATSLDLVVDLLDFDTARWTPTMRDDAERRLPAGTVPDGIVLSEKAAADLGVSPGDQLSVEHSRRVGERGFEQVTTSVPVSAVHPDPLRPTAYLDAARAELFNLVGFANQIQVWPAAGIGENDLRRSLLDNPTVATVVTVTATTRGMRDMIAQFTDLLGLVVAFVLVLVLLIAFNAASISMDERVRQHATMLAFGLRTRRVLGNAMVESLLIGLLGTGLGLAAGAVATWWAIAGLLGSTLPDFDIQPMVSGQTMLVSLVLGVVAVTVAPLFTIRRLRGMDIPAALRVVE